MNDREKFMEELDRLSDITQDQINSVLVMLMSHSKNHFQQLVMLKIFQKALNKVLGKAERMLPEEQIGIVDEIIAHIKFESAVKIFEEEKN